MSDVLAKIKGKKVDDKTKTRKLVLVSSKGGLDMAYPPLILANAARMSGIECEIFFTFWGLDLITKKKMGKVNIGPSRRVLIDNCPRGCGIWFDNNELQDLTRDLAEGGWQVRPRVREFLSEMFPLKGE